MEETVTNFQILPVRFSEKRHLQLRARLTKKLLCSKTFTFLLICIIVDGLKAPFIIIIQ